MCNTRNIDPTPAPTSDPTPAPTDDPTPAPTDGMFETFVICISCT